MQTRNISKIRAAWMCPCVGVGGADALMLGVCRYATNVQWTGIAVDQQISVYGYEWYQNMTGGNVPLHQVHRNDQYKINGDINYHHHMSDAICAAAHDADIIVTWCMPKIRDYFWSFDRPVIELAQNTDVFARDCCASNDNFVSFRAACSQAARQVFPDPDSVDAILYNAIDPGRVTPRYGRELTRKMWGLEDKKIVLFMGRLVEEKNPQAIVDAIGKLSDDWVAIIIGTGYLENTLTQQAARSAPGRVIYMDASYHMGDVLAACDVFCLPTDFEGHPLAVCEAWLAGIPVVCTDIPVIKELTDIYGELCTTIPIQPDIDKDLIPALIEACQQTPEVLAKMNRARAVTWEHFTLPAAAVKWEEFLAESIYKWQKYQRRFELFPIRKLTPKSSSFTTITSVTR